MMTLFSQVDANPSKDIAEADVAAWVTAAKELIIEQRECAVAQHLLILHG